MYDFLKKTLVLSFVLLLFGSSTFAYVVIYDDNYVAPTTPTSVTYGTVDYDIPTTSDSDINSLKKVAEQVETTKYGFDGECYLHFSEKQWKTLQAFEKILSQRLDLFTDRIPGSKSTVVNFYYDVHATLVCAQRTTRFDSYVEFKVGFATFVAKLITLKG